MEEAYIYPVKRELDGVYCRVQRNGHCESVCFSDLTTTEQDAFLNTLNTEGLKRMCHLMADSLRTLGDHLDIHMED